MLRKTHLAGTNKQTHRLESTPSCHQRSMNRTLSNNSNLAPNSYPHHFLSRFKCLFLLSSKNGYEALKHKSSALSVWSLKIVLLGAWGGSAACIKVLWQKLRLRKLMIENCARFRGNILSSHSKRKRKLVISISFRERCRRERRKSEQFLVIY